MPHTDRRKRQAGPGAARRAWVARITVSLLVAGSLVAAVLVIITTIDAERAQRVLHVRDGRLTDAAGAGAR